MLKTSSHRTVMDEPHIHSIEPSSPLHSHDATHSLHSSWSSCHWRRSCVRPGGKTRCTVVLISMRIRATTKYEYSNLSSSREEAKFDVFTSALPSGHARNTSNCGFWRPSGREKRQNIGTKMTATKELAYHLGFFGFCEIPLVDCQTWCRVSL